MSKFPFFIRKSTISTHIRDMNIKCALSTKRPSLKPAHIAFREKWCNEIQDSTFWAKPWFVSDESSFSVNPTREHIYRVPGLHKQKCYQEFTQFPVKHMIWGGICTRIQVAIDARERARDSAPVPANSK
jgi:hypothetical protein